MIRAHGKVLIGVMVAAIASGCDSGDGQGGVDAAVDARVIAPPYSIDLFADARIGSQSGGPNFQNVTTDFDLVDGPFARVTLLVDLGTTCFPFESWNTNPPPPGENWPADCDAFDRNFEITIDDPVDPAVDPPAYEVMRAITPFGGPLYLEIDVTDVANGLAPGLHSLRVHITTWSDAAGQVSGSNGGWNITARLDVVPGDPPRNVLAVIPLVNGRLGFGETPTAVPFDLPADTISTRLEYRVTGHGGASDASGDCIGPADEFCHRTHHVMLDGTEIDSWEAWRNDCGDLCTMARYEPFNLDYCAENPCGAIASVQAPRANWCPGSLTPPNTWTPMLAPGPHTFDYLIDGIADGGTWRVSAMLFAFGP